MIERAAAPAAARATQFAGHHSRSLTAALVAALMGFGVTAFGIAPLAPDAADLPRRMVTETVTPENITSQLDTLASYAVALYRSDLTRAGDTVDSLLARVNVTDAAAAAFLRTDKTARRLLEGRAGKMVRVSATASGQLTELVARFPSDNADQFNTHFSRLRVMRENGQLRAVVEQGELATQLKLGSGTISSSLFASTDEARIPDPIAIQMADVFSPDIDFHRELRRGDTFSVIYEALTADGEPVTWNQAAGRLVAAEFVNAGRSYSAVYFKDGNGKGNYYSFDGQSKRRAFLSSPLEFSRVTSGFSNRLHPILKSWRQHLGVDYGAPTGTAVRSVGEGVVEFAGWQNGYGNVVKIAHANDRSTLFAHLSRMDVRPGQRVEQGMKIGAVGATGWATGPHLHFEFKVKGEHHDPLLIAKASEAIVLSPASRTQFSVVAQRFRQQLKIDDPALSHKLALAD